MSTEMNMQSELLEAIEKLRKRWGYKKAFVVANPKFFKDNFGWEADLTKECGAYPETIGQDITCYWHMCARIDDDPNIGVSPDRDTTLDSTKAIYAPYMVHIMTEEESKAYKALRKAKGCRHECPFGMPKNCNTCGYQKKIKDYKLSELIEMCTNTQDCHACPASEFCRQIDPEDTGKYIPAKWSLEFIEKDK